MTKEAEFTVLGKWLIPEILRFLWPLRLLNQWGVKFMSQAPSPKFQDYSSWSHMANVSTYKGREGGPDTASPKPGEDCFMQRTARRGWLGLGKF